MRLDKSTARLLGGAKICQLARNLATMNSKPGLYPIAVLISGGGTTLRNLIEMRDCGTLPVDIRLVISSTKEARGLGIAARASIPTLVVPKRKSQLALEHSASVFDPIR